MERAKLAEIETLLAEGRAVPGAARSVHQTVQPPRGCPSVNSYDTACIEA
ncbi:hypothetical protein [Rhabdothermincola sediminis]|nr:hypothetical protein [Rhabdothermincola sediminis]